MPVGICGYEKRTSLTSKDFPVMDAFFAFGAL